MEKYTFLNNNNSPKIHQDMLLSAREKARIRQRDSHLEQKEKPKYYHVTSSKLAIGDILVGKMPANESISSGSSGLAVFLTDRPEPHSTVLIREGRKGNESMENLFVYRVVPFGHVRRGKKYKELTCDRAEVVEILGKANEFLRSKNISPERAVSSVEFRNPPNAQKDKQPSSSESMDMLRKKRDNEGRRSALYNKLNIE
ncbi:MAG: hypothetical protein IPL87_05220 [Candidatus Moraniibacteriota bacterium]|nr:MAG: hypothetical protein IPL87_05220 [Candidatus Moranbacteria bacterium]